ncbi:hypothetical protein [Brevibacillus borstelensis]|uniref:hypothetical protein n=1 Tax=Brevibacillus borstelensis TaxID=45462 RepID=UPI00203CB51F|nr:hypothetical protein [Brevibacillus borstelensis]MCM3473187.1 hypothetical protein [Brevibacillus borstelensis]MED1851539.1 hypothetical protein [Brevibacillus borstelensis]
MAAEWQTEWWAECRAEGGQNGSLERAFPVLDCHSQFSDRDADLAVRPFFFIR